MGVWEDYCQFACAQIASGDIDPMYPLLRRFYDLEGLDAELRLWRTVLYLTWYHVGSAESAWGAAPAPRPLTEAEVRGRPTGVERRGFRGNALAAEFVRGVLERAKGDLVAWTTGFGAGEEGWDRARAELQAVKWGGPWASYKFADLLKHVHDLPITASDIGVGGGGETAGPIPGMVRLTGQPWQECARNVALQKDLMARARAAGVPLDGLDQLETTCCDFNSLCKGGYYVGHDVDAGMDHLRPLGRSHLLWKAREVFPDQYRGELSGWDGVRKPLKAVYRDCGTVLT